jgi:hypothetical protein
MKLPIRNRGEQPLIVFIEPYCDEYKVPVGGEAIVCLEDGHPHSIDAWDGQISIWVEGGEFNVEIVTEEQQSVVEALRLARTWLHRLDAKSAAAAIHDSVSRIERNEGYLNSRLQVFSAFYCGFQMKESEESPASEQLSEWLGNETLAAAYDAGGTAAYLNRLARLQAWFPELGTGPFDTDVARSAFQRAAAIGR